MNRNSTSTFNLQNIIVKFMVLAFTIHCSLFTIHCFSQGVGINIAGSPSNPKAILDVDVAGMSSKAGILFPRITTAERNAITAPIPESLLIYNTDTHCFEANYNSNWVAFGCINCLVSPAAPTSGNNIPSGTKILWSWNAVNGVAGYQWNTSSTYPGAGVNELTNPAYTQTGLECNTSYNLYVWTYNNCGNSSMTPLAQNSGSCCSVTCSGSGKIGTLAGNGFRGYAGSDGDGGQAQCAQLYYPNGVAVDHSGNVYIIDKVINQVRKVTISTGIIDNIAGNGSAGFSGDGGPASNASFYPNGIALDRSGNIYIADGGNYRIRMITASTGIVNTIAGNGTNGYSGDGGPATDANIYMTDGIAVDVSGNVYFSDLNHSVIRKITKSTGIISTVAGIGYGGYSGDGGQATAAKLSSQVGIAVDTSGNLYIADLHNNRIRKVNASGIISTIAGNGNPGFSGDGGPATDAELHYPDGIAVDCSGNVYIADNYKIRKITISTGIINTIAGNGNSGNSGDGGPATNAEIQAESVAADCSGNVYFTYWTIPTVRKVCK